MNKTRAYRIIAERKRRQNMESWEKEIRFERTYLSGLAATNICRYIPERLNESYDWATTDSDGYWIYLNDGYTAYDGGSDCGTIHEYSISDLKKAIKTIRKK